MAYIAFDDGNTMIHLTRKVFTDLAIWMIGLGLLMGIIFPFFFTPHRYTLEICNSTLVFLAGMAAGFIVSAVNIWLAKTVVGMRLHILFNHMKMVEARDTARSTHY